MNETLSLIDEKYLCHQDHYKRMCLYPERHLNNAFLENQMKNENKWHVYVNAISHCLEQHLMCSLGIFQEKRKELKVEVEKADTRIIQMQSDIDKYIQKAV